MPLMCPQCDENGVQSGLFDNRADIEAGNVKENYPPFKCKRINECGWISYKLDECLGEDDGEEGPGPTRAGGGRGGNRGGGNRRQAGGNRGGSGRGSRPQGGPAGGGGERRPPPPPMYTPQTYYYTSEYCFRIAMGLAKRADKAGITVTLDSLFGTLMIGAQKVGLVLATAPPKQTDKGAAKPKPEEKKAPEPPPPAPPPRVGSGNGTAGTNRAEGTGRSRPPAPAPAAADGWPTQDPGEEDDDLPF